MPYNSSIPGSALRGRVDAWQAIYFRFILGRNGGTLNLCGGRGNCKSERLSKQLLDRSHREKKSSFEFRKVQEPILPVERNRRIILGVHDYTGGRCLFTQVQGAVKSVHQERFPDSLPSKFDAYREAANKRCRHGGIFGQFLCNRIGNDIKLDRVLRERAVACKGFAVCGSNKCHRRMFSDVLPRLFVKVRVECFKTTRKSRSVVSIAERLDREWGLFVFWGQLEPHLISVPLCGSTSCFVRSRWIQNSVDENFAGPISELQDVEILDCGPGGFLRACHYEFRHGCSTQCGRTLDKTLLGRSNPSLQALFFSRTVFNALDLCHDCLRNQRRVYG